MNVLIDLHPIVRVPLSVGATQTDFMLGHDILGRRTICSPSTAPGGSCS
jgi:hypothetical protein